MIFGRILLVVFAVFPGVVQGGFDPWKETARYELTYDVNCSSLVASQQHVRLWIPLPRTSTHQRLVRYDVDASVGYAELTDDYGNRMLFLEPVRGAKGSCHVTVRMFVERKVVHPSVANASASGVDDPAKFLGATSKVPLGGVVGAVARKVSARITNPAMRIRAFYDYVVSNMRYSKEGKGWGHGDAVRACSVKYGNCTDFHSLLMGLSRSQGIASRFIIGFAVPAQESQGRIKGYHCWAEVFDKTTGWIAVDASEAFKSGKRDAYFGSLPSDRVAFTVGRDLTLRPPQSGPPLNFFIYPYAELDQKPVSNVPWTLTYQRVDHPG